MANLSETLTRDRPPQKVVIGNRVTRAELDPMLAAHARFIAGRIDGRRAVLLRCDLRGLALRGIDLRGADLVGFDFAGSNLTGACFVGATLTVRRSPHRLLTAARFPPAAPPPARLE